MVPLIHSLVKLEGISLDLGEDRGDIITRRIFTHFDSCSTTMINCKFLKHNDKNINCNLLCFKEGAAFLTSYDSVQIVF